MKWLLSALGGVLVVGVIALLVLGARDGRGKATAAVEIDKPPASVFPLLVQPELRKQWALGMVEFTPVGDPTLRSGARARVVLDSPERMEVEEEIRVVETDRRLLLQRVSSHPPFNQRLEYVLRDLGAGRALVTAAIHTSYQGALANLLEPLMTRAAQTRLDQELDQLRATALSASLPQAAALPVVATPVTPVPSATPTPAPATPAETAPPAASPPATPETQAPPPPAETPAETPSAPATPPEAAPASPSPPAPEAQETAPPTSPAGPESKATESPVPSTSDPSATP